MEKFYLPYPLLPSEIILYGAQETFFYCYGRYCNTSEDITTQLLILYLLQKVMMTTHYENEPE